MHGYILNHFVQMCTHACECAQIGMGPRIIIIALTADSKIHTKSITPFSCFCCILSSPDSPVSHK